MNEEIVEALAKARWNESVHVKIHDDNGESLSSLVLVPQLDRENGGIRWENAASESSNASTEGHVRTKIWMFPMLNDERRNCMYEEAIERASKEVTNRFCAKNDDDDDDPQRQQKQQRHLRTLDIGSGTGLLALLSSKHLACKTHVTSLEMAGPMADVARQTVALQTNQSSSSIDIVEGHSCRFPSMMEEQHPVVLCTSELLESGVLGEGWLPAMRDAWERHLHPRAVVLPQVARVFARLVSGVSGFVGPTSSLDVAGNMPPLRLVTTTPEREDNNNIGFLSDGCYDPVTGRKQGIQVEIHADRFLNGDSPILRVLSDPIETLDFDVTSKDSIPHPDPTTRTPRRIPFVVTQSGKAEGVLFWWELDLYKGDPNQPSLNYTTEPGSDFQDHWHQCLYVFPPDHRNRHCVLEKGREYTLLASHTDSRVHFSLDNEKPTGDDILPAAKRPKPTIPPDSNPIFGPRRCWQLNDTDRLGKFRDGIRVALETLRCDNKAVECANVLDVSDFSLCGMMASLLGAKRVTSIESSSSGLPLAAARVAQLGNGLPSGNNNNNEFQIVQCHAESLTQSILSGTEEDQDDPVVDLIVGEPYYEMLEGWSIETALNFFYTLRMLKQRRIVRSSALCVPARAVILACGIDCKDIGKSYRRGLFGPNNDDYKTEESTSLPKAQCCVRGFDHQPVVDCWKYDQHGISIPLWEYNGVVPVTEVVEIGTLDYETNTIQDSKWTMDDASNMDVIHAPFTKSEGSCHAIAFWIDYKIRNSSSAHDDESLSFTTVSTGFASPSQCVEKQTVRILSVPQPVREGESLRIPRHDLQL